MTAVERTTRYATRVDSLAEAWAFAMEHLDALGDAPSIDIKPVWSSAVTDTDGNWQRHFDISVSGMQEMTP